MVESNDSTKGLRARASKKARNALEAHRLEEQRRRDAEKKKRAELEAAAKVEQSLELAAQREQQRKQEAEVRARLGRAVLDNIRSSGFKGTLLTAEELASWPKEHREQLSIVISMRRAANAATAEDVRDAPESRVDIDLNG